MHLVDLGGDAYELGLDVGGALLERGEPLGLGGGRAALPFLFLAASLAVGGIAPHVGDAACDLLERAAADIGGDDGAGPLRDVAGDGVGRAEAEHLVPDDHLPEIDD